VTISTIVEGDVVDCISPKEILVMPKNLHMRKRCLHTMSMLGVALTAVIAFQVSCGSVGPADGTSNDDGQIDSLALDENGRPVGWTEATHSKQGPPDYAMVFPEGAVRRIDVTIAPSNWQAMLDDMTSNYGAFGTGGQGGGPGPIGGAIPPGGPNGGNGDIMLPELTDACEELREGDACTVSFNGITINGTCASGGDTQLACRPQTGFGDLPDGGIGDTTCDTCSGLVEGAACNCTVNGTAIEGACIKTTDGQLVCRSQVDPGGNGGIPGGGGIFGDDTNPIVVPCTVAFEGKTWWYVGIRFKGNSSLMSTWSSGIYKLPLRLDFDSLEDEHSEIAGQRFFGFEKLSLGSNWSDPSYLREKVTHDIFRNAGVPAPRTAFYRVYIDVGDGPTYFGLYAMTEIPDNPMLQAWFGDDSGNLYKPESNWVTFNQDNFDKESNKDAADWSDVEAAIAALHADRSDPGAWRAGLEALFNVDGFLRWLAVNTVIVNWDTYGRMAHNYYLYANPNDGGRLSWIPWDNNMAMAEMGGGIGGGSGGLSLGLTEVGDQWPLIRYLMDDAVYRATYVSHMRTFVDGAFNVTAIQERFQAAHDLIAPYVTGAEPEQSGYTLLNSPGEFDTALNNLLQFVADRSAAAIEFLGTQP
jgi:hypothetical protein